MFDSNQFFGAQAGFYPNPIDQSLRFNDDDSAYLSRTPASAGNRKTWTWSGWVKRGNLSGSGSFGIFEAGTTSNITSLFFLNDELYLQDFVTGSYNLNWKAQGVFRDVSSWYHIVCKFDTTEASGGNCVQLYINGVENLVTFNQVTGSYTQNADRFVNSTSQHRLGTYNGISNYFDGYLAEVHFIDGTAYDETAFGEFKEGVWVAKAPSVTYGTNGFYLDFANSADIGNDVSGEGNDWTPNNFTASDVVLDSPTDNFATLNPLDINTSRVSLADGNLLFDSSDGSSALSTIAIDSGKYYAEFELVTTSGRECAGVATIGSDTSVNPNSESGFIILRTGFNVDIFKDGSVSQEDVDGTYSPSAGDIIGVALNLDDEEVTFYINGVQKGVAESLAASTAYHFTCGSSYGSGGSVDITANFGQQDFDYTPPTGYLALSTANLPDPAIDPAQGSSPEDYFNTVLWTGNGSARSITGVGFQPDFVWTKGRSGARTHLLFDAIRGNGAYLLSAATSAEVTDTNTLSTFDSDGFTIGTNTTVNTSGETFVAWNWKANGSGVSNTDGSITSTVSANTESGFSIVGYTGVGGSATIGHGLDNTPEMIIVKERTSTSGWLTYTSTTGAGKNLLLESTSGEISSTSVWNNTAPTSSVFSVGNNGTNENTQTYIAYCFHSVEGFSKFGSYTGNGSTDGTFVYLGFRPAFILTKRNDSSQVWSIIDSKRDAFNVAENPLRPNTSESEGTAFDPNTVDLLSNGFKFRDGGTRFNSGSATYIYMAFAENPFKYSNAR